MTRIQRVVPRAVGEPARRAFARRFEIDLRALAAFRITLGALLLADLGLRAVDMTAFYTDAGVLPRAALFELYPGLADISLHATVGSVWAQAILFAITGAFGLALLAGYRTQIATVGSLVLLGSLHARNPIVLNAGDLLLLHFLFWGVFLPLGRRWSIDARRSGNTEEGECALSVASVAVLLQVVIVYAANAAFKLRHDVWTSGDALGHVFDLDRLTVLLGPYLAQYPGLLEVLTWLWLALVTASVLLVVLVGWPRVLLVVAFAGAHVGMLLTLRVGVFPLISIAGLLLFLPADIWDRVEDRGRPVEGRLEGVLEGGRGPLRPGHVVSTSADATDVTIPAGVSRGGSRAVTIVVAVALVLVLAWNAVTLGYGDPPAAVETTVDPDQHRWDMFAAGGGDDGWYVVPGELESGEQVDAFGHSQVDWDRPPDVADTYPSHRWLLYLVKIQHPAYADHRVHFAEYLCREWNSNHDDRLVGLTVYYVEQPTQIQGEAEATPRELIEHSCA